MLGTARLLRTARALRVFSHDPLPDHVDAAIRKLQPLLSARLRKPRGWPGEVPLPDWWDQVALGFDIERAKWHICKRCGYEVAVKWRDKRNRCRWSCPQCGEPARRPRSATGKRAGAAGPR